MKYTLGNISLSVSDTQKWRIWCVLFYHEQNPKRKEEYSVHQVLALTKEEAIAHAARFLNPNLTVYAVFANEKK